MRKKIIEVIYKVLLPFVITRIPVLLEAALSPQAFGAAARGLHGRLSVHQSAQHWQLRAGGHCGQAQQHAADGAS